MENDKDDDSDGNNGNKSSSLNSALSHMRCPRWAINEGLLNKNILTFFPNICDKDSQGEVRPNFNLH